MFSACRSVRLSVRTLRLHACSGEALLSTHSSNVIECHALYSMTRILWHVTALIVASTKYSNSSSNCSSFRSKFILVSRRHDVVPFKTHVVVWFSVAITYLEQQGFLLSQTKVCHQSNTKLRKIITIFNPKLSSNFTTLKKNWEFNNFFVNTRAFPLSSFPSKDFLSFSLCHNNIVTEYCQHNLLNSAQTQRESELHWKCYSVQRLF